MTTELPAVTMTVNHNLQDYFLLGNQELYGPHAGMSIPLIPQEENYLNNEAYSRGMSIRVGRNAFLYWLRENQEHLGWEDTDFRLLPSRKKMVTGLEEISSWFAVETDADVSVHDLGEEWQIRYEPAVQLPQTRIPYQWEFLQGFLQEFTRWAGQGRLYRIQLSEGKSGCIFTCSKLPID